MEAFIQQIKDFFSNAGLNILFGIVILVVGLILCKLIKVILRKILRRTKRDEAMINFVVSFADVVLKIVVMITALATMGVNTASIIAVVGTCGVAIGLALKDSLGNLASGIIILYNKPFKKDDYVEIAGREGQIAKINLFNTTLVTYDNTVIVVPNSEAVNNPIVNYDGRPLRRVVVDIVVAKGTDIEYVKELALRVAEGEPLVSRKVDTTVRLEEQTTDCVKLKLKAYAATPDYWDAKYNLAEKLYAAFKDEDLLPPNEQIDVHIEMPEEKEATAVRQTLQKGKPRKLDVVHLKSTGAPTAADGVSRADDDGDSD